MAIDQPCLASIFNLNVGLADADLPGADRFNLRSLKRQSGFVRFQNKIFEPRFPVRCDSFLAHAFYFSTTPPQRQTPRAALFPLSDFTFARGAEETRASEAGEH